MTNITPLKSGIKVKQFVAENGLRNIALVFLHGIGDILMFRSVFDQFKNELSDVNVTLFVHQSQESLIEGAVPWVGDSQLAGFEASFILEFPMSEGSSKTKAALCAEIELGLDSQDFDIKKMFIPTNRQVAVHFHGTCLPGAVNPPPEISRRIYDKLLAYEFVPVEVHFEHLFHNPLNTKPDWVKTTVRGIKPSVEKLYSIINNSCLFIGVASGPLVMAIAIDDSKVIYLQKDFKLGTYTDHKVKVIDLNQYDDSLLDSYLQEYLDQTQSPPTQDLPGDDLVAKLTRAKSLSPHNGTAILGALLQQVDAAEDYVQGSDYYPWYYAIGMVLRPKRVAEIGIRYGYSVKSMADGSITGGTPKEDIEIFGFDNESSTGGCVSVAHQYLNKEMGLTVELSIVDTQKKESLNIKDIDVFHVDGNHSYDNYTHDLKLAYECVKKEGYLLVDDISLSDVKRAADEFCEEHALDSIYLPTLRGMYIVRKNNG